MTWAGLAFYVAIEAALLGLLTSPKAGQNFGELREANVIAFDAARIAPTCVLDLPASPLLASPRGK